MSRMVLIVVVAVAVVVEGLCLPPVLEFLSMRGLRCLGMKQSTIEMILRAEVIWNRGAAPLDMLFVAVEFELALEFVHDYYCID